MSITDFISLFSGIALFLFGMTLMGDGLKKVAGNRMELILYRLTGNPLKGFLLGVGVTAVIQSSSATSVMVVGFVNSGMMQVRQAIPIVLGSILGTSITGWVVAMSEIGSTGSWTDLFSTAVLTGIISIIGILLRMFSKNPARRHVGDILMGFAVLMFGMSAMSQAVSPLRDSPALVSILTTFSHPFVGIAVGIVFTCVLQSASAAVGILQALSSTGIIDFAVALPIIMGIAIGAAMPVLLSSIGATVNGRRTAMVYLVAEVAGVILFGVGFYAIHAFVHFPFMETIMTSVSIALVNTIFRLIKVVVLTPFSGVIEKAVSAMIPDKPRKEPVVAEGVRLEERFIQHPALAVEQSRLTIHAMAQEAKENLIEGVTLLHGFTEERYKKVVEMENSVDRYEDKLGTYLVRLTGRELTPRQNESVSLFLHTISDFERISDHALNIADAAKELHEKNMAFSDEAAHELEVLQSALCEILNNTVQAFVTSDLRLAAKVEPLEQLIDGLCDEMKLHHVDRLQKGQCTLTQGFVFNDLLTNFERVGDHCSNIAVALIELESDSFDTHEYLSSVKELHSAAFDRAYEEYSRIYKL